MSDVREAFDRIAPGWYGFRHRTIFRRELEALAQRWQKGRLLNLGCGHGPDFLPFKNSFELHGMDFSGEMLRLARKYADKFEFAPFLVQADLRCLPYKDASFDWAIAVATYHHLRGRKAQLKAFIELRRVLKPAGEAFITVWNHYQPRFWLKPGDILVPWRLDEETINRFYHLFSYPELEGLVAEAGLTVLRSYAESSYRLPVKLFSRNICLLVRK